MKRKIQVFWLLTFCSLQLTGCRSAGPHVALRNCENCTVNVSDSKTDANQGKTVPINVKATGLP